MWFTRIFVKWKLEIPPSRSQIGLLNTDVKSKSIPIFDAGQVLPNSLLTVDSHVIDGPSLVNSKQPNCQTFVNYANDIILPHITSLAWGHWRVDIVFNVCKNDCQKVKLEEGEA